jgi:hypothetical protein
MTCMDMAPADVDRIFFSDNPNRIQQAKQICSGCPQSNNCITIATQTKQAWGVWGGEDQASRRRRLGINCYGTTR